MEPHWYPIGLDFISRCIRLEMSSMTFLLYAYMLIRSSPDTRKREKNAHLYGDFIQKGEFFENKISVADFFGKTNLKDKDKRNWFLRAVRPLVQFGLVKKIESGKRGFNATYIVYDIRSMPMHLKSASQCDAKWESLCESLGCHLSAPPIHK
jgi:hypothetical protein